MFVVEGVGFSATMALPHPTVELPPFQTDTGKRSPTTPAISTAAPISRLRNRLFTLPSTVCEVDPRKFARRNPGRATGGRVQHHGPGRPPPADHRLIMTLPPWIRHENRETTSAKSTASASQNLARWREYGGSEAHDVDLAEFI